MVKLKRVSILSCVKIFGILYAILGFIGGFIFFLFSLFGAVIGGGGDGIFAGFAFGLASMILFPLFYGIIGLIAGALMGVTYNIASSLVGGLKFEVEKN